ncbi:4'-phosphopantetheinyl transferase superfamily protein [Sphaerotilus sp.]|uniref:4'-phosphopantetheinyl transferase family protein n=1 Tax=Sphaerotilus sp. TaxID=2093942 RepID=UPI00286E2519|nr:4'-phosphopantetheinyl transferase superfamily protein [Sphaerotilus sp.]
MPALSCLDLERGQLDLHLLPVTTECEDDLALLSGDESARALRFRRTADRVLFIQAHGLLRRVLSCYAVVAPGQWHFVRGPWGKPAVCPQRHPTLQDLRFNLSHCAGRAAVAVAWGREVGVDIERFDALAQPGELALSILGPHEQQGWQQVGPHLRAQQHFLMTHWTLKEAVLKAMGLGLSQIAPHHLEVLHSEDGSGWQARPCVAQAAALRDWSRHGWLHGALEGQTHHWALACERQPGETVSWRLIHHPAPIAPTSTTAPVA